MTKKVLKSLSKCIKIIKNGGFMTIESPKMLTEETLLNEFDDVVELHGGIQRELWNGQNTPKSLREEIDALPQGVEFEECGDGNVKLPNGDIVADLRNLDFITVDPRSCKDMDDAVCCEIADNGDYILYTAVADVPRYFDLPENLDDIDSLDSIGKVYLAGGYTMYSPFKAYGILPEELSDNLCSLKEGEERLAFVTRIVINKETGEQKGEPVIMEGVIKSRAKLSYNEAQAIIDDDKEGYQNNPSINTRVKEQVVKGLIIANEIRKGFAKRDMVRFPDEQERRVRLTNGKIEVELEKRIEYQDVIEAFMIMTNEANAKFAYEHKVDAIYRLHDAPNTNADGEDILSLMRLLEYIPLYGFDEEIESVSQVSPGTFNRIFDLVKGGGAENEVYKRFLARIQTRAKSSTIPVQTTCCDGIGGREYQFSHFGLQSKYYMHITSPIRRITDYVNMKNILAYVQEKKPLSSKLVSEIAMQADRRRLEVDNAEMGFGDILASHYYQDHTEMINASICDFDYSKNGFCIYKDDRTGFRINVPIEEFSHGLFIGQEKWGFTIYDDVVATLGQKNQILVCVNDDLTISGQVVNSKIKQSSFGGGYQEGQYSRKKKSKKESKMKHNYDEFDDERY